MVDAEKRNVENKAFLRKHSCAKSRHEKKNSKILEEQLSQMRQKAKSLSLGCEKSHRLYIFVIFGGRTHENAPKKSPKWGFSKRKIYAII